jgi:TP901 family phage tail tape measure protein
MAEPIQRLFVEISADLSGLRKGLGQAQEEVNRFSSGVGKIGSTLTKSVALPVAGAATAASAGIAAFVADSVKTFAEFEKNLSGVRAVLGATEAEAKKLGDLAIKLGMDPRLVVTTAQAVQVMEELAKNGLTAQQILDGAARAAIALANAAGVDFATAADVASTTMQLFKLRAQDMGRVVDMITGVANTSRFSVDDFRLAIAQAGAMAASVGISIEDFATTIAALSTKFASGSDAGTSFKVFLQRLVPQSEKAKDAMKELGIITKDGRNQFFNAKGELRSMAEIAEVLRVSLAKLSDEQRIQALTTIFGTDAMRTAIGLMELGGEGFKKMRAEMEKASAAENAAMRMKNLAGAMEILGGVIEGLKIKIGEAFAPAVLKVVQAFSDFLDENSERIQGLFARLAEEAGRMAERIVSALETEGPRVISLLEGLFSDLPSLIAGLADIGKTVAGGVVAVAGALAMLPPGSAGTILAIVGALTVLGPVLSGLAGVISIISTLIGLVGGLTGALSALSGIAGTVAGAIGAISAALGLPVAPILLLIALAAGLYLAWQNNWLGIRNVVSAAVQAIIGFFNSLWDETVRIFNLIVESIRSAFRIDWGAIGAGIINGIRAGIEGAVGSLVAAAVNAARSALNAAKSALGIRSPSKVFEKEVGRPMALGMAEGFQAALKAFDVLPSILLPEARPPALAPQEKKMEIQVNIHNPRGEPSEESLRRQLRNLAYLGVI